MKVFFYSALNEQLTLTVCEYFKSSCVKIEMNDVY